jgi:Fic family protein
MSVNESAASDPQAPTTESARSAEKIATGNAEDLPARYKPFPSFAEWLSQPATTVGFDAVSSIVEELTSKPEDLRRKALDVVRNVAALETGAIEDLYPSDRGLTITAAAGVAILESIASKHGEAARSYLAAALDAYELVLDFSTKKAPIGQAWIRQLHAAICKNQETYKVRIAETVEERPLPKGEYKHLPNHVLQPNGTVHYYAPPEVTQSEMARLVDELSLVEFGKAHPIEQASYAHYALVAIHPFCDGNGRVARAFASLYTYRAYSLPLLIYATQRETYFAALAEADAGSVERIKGVIGRSVTRAARLLRESFVTAQGAQPLEAFRRLTGMYRTSGGYLQVEVDQAAISLIHMVQGAIQKKIRELLDDEQTPVDQRKAITLSSAVGGGNWAAPSPEFRRPIEAHQNRVVTLSAASNAPADAAENMAIGVSLPRDATPDDVFILDTSPAVDPVEIPLSDLMSGDTLEAEMFIAIFADRVISKLLARVRDAGRESLRKKGFGPT